jgi:hypothetical protein
VRVFDGQTGKQLASFFPFGKIGLRSFRIHSTGDSNHDGRPEMTARPDDRKGLKQIMTFDLRQLTGL